MITMAHRASFAASGHAAWLASDATKALVLAAFGKGMLTTSLMAGITLTAGAGFGALIYQLSFLPIHHKPKFPVRSLIVMLAINLATVHGLLWYFGPKQKNLPKIFGTGKLEFLGLSARYGQIGAILATAIMLGLTLFWLKTSRTGLEIRAMMQNPEGAVLSGRWRAGRVGGNHAGRDPVCP